MTFPYMTPDEYAEWQELNRLSRQSRASSPCADCLIGFAIEMRAQGLCVGLPGGADAPVPLRTRRPPDPVAEHRRSEALRLHALGMRQSDIARLFGVSRTTVLNYVRGRRPQLTRAAVRKRSRERAHEARLLRAQGLSFAAIGRRIGVSEAQATKYIKAAA